MALDKLYQQAVLAHNREPYNQYPMVDASHTALGNNALCGDEIIIYVRLNADKIEAASFSGQACAIATAAASLMTNWLVGRSVTEAKKGQLEFQKMMQKKPINKDFLGENTLLAAVADFPARIKSATLCWHAMVAALDGVSEVSTEK